MTSLSSTGLRWLLACLCLSSALLVRPVLAAETPSDRDGDGLTDAQEVLFGTSRDQADSDSDGFADGLEVMNAWSPTTTLPIRLPKSLFITLSTQTLERRVMGITVSTDKISGGLPRTPTPTGTFTVLNKHPRAWSRSAGLWMPYWMAFTKRGHGIHELPEWPGGRKEGQSHLGKPASHGCVRLGVGAAKLAYEWSEIGTPITIVK